MLVIRLDDIQQNGGLCKDSSVFAVYLSESFFFNEAGAIGY